MSSFAAQQNAGLDLNGRVAAVAGGTQGIGAATAIRFAEGGASVYVIGRNEQLGSAVVEELKKAGKSPEQKFEFLKADLSLVSSLKEVASTLEKKAGSHGVDYFVTSAGKPPNGKFAINSEGNESHFAVQLLGRFGLAYLLAKSGTVKESVVFVCAPSGKNGTPPDPEDLQLKKAKENGKYGMLACASRDSAVADGFTAGFANAFPNLRTLHTYPGVVASNAATNGDLPYPMIVLSNLFNPIIARTFGNSPKSYADVPVFLAANPKSKELPSAFTDYKLKDQKPKWVDEKPEIAKAVWDQMVHLMEA